MTIKNPAGVESPYTTTNPTNTSTAPVTVPTTVVNDSVTTNTRTTPVTAPTTVVDDPYASSSATTATRPVGAATVQTGDRSFYASGIPGLNELVGSTDAFKGANVYLTLEEQKYITNNTTVTGGNGVPGGANSQVQFNDSGTFNGSSGFTYNKTTGSIQLSGNVTGGNLVTGAQVIASGVIQSGTGLSTGGYLSVNGTADLHDTTVTGNISATGNIAGNYFIGNGSQLTGISASANTGNVTFNDVNIIGTGNLNLQPDPADATAYVNIYLTGAADIHMAAGTAGANLILGTDEEANVAVLQGGNVAIQAGNVSGTQTWTFDTAGNLTLPGGSEITEVTNPGGFPGYALALVPDTNNAIDADQQLLIYPTGNVVADVNHLHLTSGNLYNTELFLGNDNLYVKLANTGNVVINSNDDVGNSAQWTFDTTGRVVNLEGLTLTAGGQFNICTILTGGSGYGGGGSFSATTGGSGTGLTVGYGYGLSGQVVNASVINPGDGNYQDGDVITMTAGNGAATFRLTQYNVLGNQANNNFVESSWTFGAAGGTIFPTLTTQRGDNPSGTITGQTLLFGDATQEAIISTPDGVAGINGDSSQRLVINPGEGYQGGEGGDIYLWAGRGGNASGSGGDIKIRGGQGGANTVGGAGGSGGYIRMEAGDSQNLGTPGYIDITGGYGANTYGGYVQVTGGQGGNGQGGPVQLLGGYGATGFKGGDANIIGGSSADGVGSYGNVNIGAGATTWRFDNTGNLTVPGGIVGSGASPAPYLSGFDSVSALTLSASGNVTGGNITTAGVLKISGSSSYIDVAGTGFIQNAGMGEMQISTVAGRPLIINTNAGAYGWRFGTAGNLTLPNGGTISGTGNITAGYFIGNGSQLTGIAASYGNADVAANLAAFGSNPISTTGNITAGNFIGNGSQLTNVATSTTGSWTLAAGTNTVSFSVPLNGTYSLWVRGNIPNGIVTYTATAVVTNNNVPVLGASYGWYYAVGNALVLTAIPTQFVGTLNNISNASIVTTTANVFTFGITNNSGNTAVVNYGYTKL